MAINKIKKHQNEIPYEMVPREVAQSIDNPHALAIWMYLLTKPDDWIVRRTDIKTHFSIGDQVYSKAMNYLYDGKLCKREVIQDKGGKIANTVIHVHSLPYSPLTVLPENPEHGKTVIREISTLKENRLSKEEDNTKENDINVCFERFWFAGMRKIGKKQSLAAFTKAAKKNGDLESFTNLLINDVRQRVLAQQFGFDKLHPERYLKNERWNDEVQRNETNQRPDQQRKLSAVERVAAANGVNPSTMQPVQKGYCEPMDINVEPVREQVAFNNGRNG